MASLLQLGITLEKVSDTTVRYAYVSPDGDTRRVTAEFFDHELIGPNVRWHCEHCDGVLIMPTFMAYSDAGTQFSQDFVVIHMGISPTVASVSVN